MDVRGIGSLPSTQFVSQSAPAAQQARPERVATALNPQDEIHLTTSETLAAPNLREMRLSAIQSQIEAGTYDTPERFDAALERMLQSIGAFE